MSAYFQSEIQITELTIDKVNLINQSQGRFRTQWKWWLIRLEMK